MLKSTLTCKGQTTVPKEIRVRLGLQPHDPLLWEMAGGSIVVTPGSRRFLDLRGTVRVGSGSSVEDVKEARSLRGRIPW